MRAYQLTDWLPTTRKEVELREWDALDVILFSADAYVDHPSFGAAVIGRTLEAEGLRTAIVPQPNWRDDLRDFKKLGRPRLFFGVAPGCMDSMVNKYTANKRLRSEDAYTPDGRHDMRPEYPTIVYTRILKELYPDVPVILGGIEASMRRLTHYDYWQDTLRKSILIDSGADLLIYGMGEKPIVELCRKLQEHPAYSPLPTDIPQTAYLCGKENVPGGIHPEDVRLFPHEECLKDKRKQAMNIRHIEEESNKYAAQRILQETGKQMVVVNPPYPPMSEAELDRSFDLPYTRLPHPKYKGKRIPAYDMIKFSVNIHRGCFGGCAFCTISAHQGKFIVSRSKESILKEVKAITEMPDFKGYLSDLGGPSANMYRMGGKDKALCGRCKRPSCIHPKVCPNLNTDHRPLLDLYRSVDALPRIKKSFIGSGVRYDLLLRQSGDEHIDRSAREYCIFIGALKGDKTELVVQKAVELGASRIVVFSSRYSSAYMNENKLERLNRVSREAAKQCLRSTCPPVGYCESFSSALEAAKGYDTKLFACEFLTENEGTMSEIEGSCAVMVGSEGGFTEEEFALARAAGFKGITLGKRILRAETAAIACLSVVAYHMGELG